MHGDTAQTGRGTRGHAETERREKKNGQGDPLSKEPKHKSTKVVAMGIAGSNEKAWATSTLDVGVNLKMSA